MQRFFLVALFSFVAVMLVFWWLTGQEEQAVISKVGSSESGIPMMEDHKFGGTELKGPADCKDVESRLAVFDVSYYDFEGVSQKGQIKVLGAVVDHVLSIFRDLYDLPFRIYKVDINDETGKGTRAYRCSNLSGKSARSIHSYGLAIDVNPQQNPSISVDLGKQAVVGVVPEGGIRNLNRLPKRPGKSDRMGLVVPEVVSVFAKHGFNHWGGYWDVPSIDYMRFEVSRPMAILLVAMSTDDASKFFDLHVDLCRMLPDERITTGLAELMLQRYFDGKMDGMIASYRMNRDGFFVMAEKLVADH